MDEMGGIVPISVSSTDDGGGGGCIHTSVTSSL